MLMVGGRDGHGDMSNVSAYVGWASQVVVHRGETKSMVYFSQLVVGLCISKTRNCQKIIFFNFSPDSKNIIHSANYFALASSRSLPEAPDIGSRFRRLPSAADTPEASRVRIWVLMMWWCNQGIPKTKG